jgi:hypothetical protein|tara:strand:- start:1205 stop:1306 length:102 start_codon:yes stop_codon:yes gene_type:complete
MGLNSNLTQDLGGFGDLLGQPGALTGLPINPDI